MGEPDELKKNPRYACAAPMRLYLEARVLLAEHTTAFSIGQSQASKRSTAATRVANKRAAALIARTRLVSISVKQWDTNELSKKAIRHYYDERKEQRAIKRGDSAWEPACEKSDSTFLQRIQVNFLRHEATRYEQI